MSLLRRTALRPVAAKRRAKRRLICYRHSGLRYSAGIMRPPRDFSWGLSPRLPLFCGVHDTLQLFQRVEVNRFRVDAERAHI